VRVGVCLRSFDFEARSESSDGRTLEGYAAVFNSPTKIRDLQGEFEESIAPGAFARSLEKRTPILQWDHGRDPAVGTAPIGDIEDLREDGRGLYVRARMYDHPSTERVRLAIKGRSVKGMSFRFSVPDGGDHWSKRDGLDRREIRDVDIAELGPVAFPAYDATSVTVRSLLAGLDPEQYRALLEELAADLRNLPDLTGQPVARSAGGGDAPGRQDATRGLSYDALLLMQRNP
jgi:HK97 family phage prohead protease